MIYAIIPARSESKRVKNKNFLSLKNDTLLSKTLDVALDLNFIDKIIVSSDKRLTFKNKEKVVFNKRPKSLSNDRTTTDRVISYLINKYKIKKEDIIILLQPTSPLRDPINIKESFDLFFKKKKPVYSVEMIQNSDRYFIMEYDKIKSLPFKFFLKQNGAIYIFKVMDFLKNKKIPNDFYPYVMEKINSIDIDDYLDYITTLNIY